jgi:hypothetical protein
MVGQGERWMVRMEKNMMWADYNMIGVPFLSNGLKRTFPWWEKTLLTHTKRHRSLNPKKKSSI